MKLSLHRPPMLACGLALLIAAGGMLVSTSGAQAAATPRGRTGQGHQSGSLPQHHRHLQQCGCHYNGGELTDVRGTLYFSANDGKHGFELWRSDGTARGTRMVKDINPGRGWSNLYGIKAVGRIIYFTADDGVHGAELWRSDGTARGTRMVKDINPGGSGGPGQFTDVNGTLYFTASDGNYVSELWRSDGTEAGTTMVKSVSAVALTDFHGTLYFSAVREGCGGATAPRRERPSSRTTSSSAPTTAHRRQRHPLLRRRRRRPRQRAVAKRRHRGRHDHGQGLRPGELPLPPTNVNGRPLLLASLGPGPIPNELWRSDGTEAGTTLVKRGVAYGYTAFKGRIYFSAEGGLWRSDGTPQGTTLVKGKPAGGSLGGSLTAAKGTLYFVGTEKRHGQELWRSDGTRAGTTIVRDIRRGSATSDPGTSPQSAARSSSPPRTAGMAGSCGGPGQNRARRPRGSARRGRTPRDGARRGGSKEIAEQCCFGRKAAPSIRASPKRSDRWPDPFLACARRPRRRPYGTSGDPEQLAHLDVVSLGIEDPYTPERCLMLRPRPEFLDRRAPSAHTSS